MGQVQGQLYCEETEEVMQTLLCHCAKDSSWAEVAPFPMAAGVLKRPCLLSAGHGADCENKPGCASWHCHRGACCGEGHLTEVITLGESCEAACRGMPPAIDFVEDCRTNLCISPEEPVAEVFVVHHHSIPRVTLLNPDDFVGLEEDDYPAAPPCVTALRRERIQSSLRRLVSHENDADLDSGLSDESRSGDFWDAEVTSRSVPTLWSLQREVHGAWQCRMNDGEHHHEDTSFIGEETRPFTLRRCTDKSMKEAWVPENCEDCETQHWDNKSSPLSDIGTASGIARGLGTETTGVGRKPPLSL